MVRGMAVLIALWLAAAHGAAQVVVQPRGARLDLTATRAPASEVLDRLARQTGMKVVYDGAPPRQPVTVSIRDRTPADAVAEVLEGLGVNYALLTDPSGERAQTLMVTARAGTASTVAVGPGASAGRPMPPRGQEPNSHRPYVPGEGSPEPPADDGLDDAGQNPVPPEVNDPPQGPVGPPPMMGQPQGPMPQQPNPAPSPQPTPPPWIVSPQQFGASPFTPQATAPVPTAPGASQPQPQQPQQPR
ncbi:MAG TPA: hypothetical protein VEQ10_07315 [Vicinamibacteria bacterium]|nr:hypothetical protein [Vicinamibacteria bacterium]